MAPLLIPLSYCSAVSLVRYERQCSGDTFSFDGGASNKIQIVPENKALLAFIVEKPNKNWKNLQREIWDISGWASMSRVGRWRGRGESNPAVLQPPPWQSSR